QPRPPRSPHRSAALRLPRPRNPRSRTRPPCRRSSRSRRPPRTRPPSTTRSPRSTRASPNSSGASPPTRPRSPTTSAIRSGRSGSRGRETWPRSRIACRGSRTSCARCASSARRSRAPLPVPPERTIVALAGGVGAARFLAGLVRAAPPEHVAVIANTGDDMRFYGVHVSPDVDIVTYTLAGLVDRARGYGLEGDTTAVIDALGALGHETWFRLGDRDFAHCHHRTLPLAPRARPRGAAGQAPRAARGPWRVLH